MLCLNCNQPSGHHCTRCKHANYCTIACQKEHWPKHKFVCAVPGSSLEESFVFINPRPDRSVSMHGENTAMLASDNLEWIEIAKRVGTSQVVLAQAHPIHSASMEAALQVSVNW